MTIRLAVNETRWQDHVQSVARSMPGLVPVVKGNGYGFRRWNLMPLAGQLAGEVAVGTVYEVRDVPAGIVPIVLTPTLTVPPQNMPRNAVLTVGSLEHLRALVQHGWRGEVMIKLQSSVMRFGASPAEFVPLVEELRRNHFTVHGYAVHPPLEGDPTNHVRDIEKWMRLVPNDAPVYVSHLDAAAYEHVRSRHPERAWRIRLGSALWHGDKSMLHLAADVLDVHRGASGRAGYRLAEVPDGSTIVLAGAGTSHGAFPDGDGRSPFHFARRRLPLIEPPHMHTSMLVVADGGPCPEPGDLLDAQLPLTRSHPDVVEWS